MIDKQIIIDGVDVAGRKYFNRLRNICHNKNLCCDCEKNQDCIYKKFKRKEQECDELKEEIKHYKQIAQYHGNLSVKYTNKSAKLKQTLIEIKEITEKQVKRAPDGETFARPEIKQILQKISECEVE